MCKVFRILFLFGLIVQALSVKGQVNEKTVKYSLFELASARKVTVFNREMKTFSEGKYQGIHLSDGSREGIVWINGVEFDTGTIELDIKGKNVPQKSFVGLAFHGAADSVYEAVYFRPFNFLATDSVKRIHAVQYIAHPEYTWQKLRAEKNAQYEKELKPAPQPDEWLHVKIEVQEAKVEVVVNGNATPSLSIARLSSQKGGKVGLWVGDGSDGYFANLVITRSGK